MSRCFALQLNKSAHIVYYALLLAPEKKLYNRCLWREGVRLRVREEQGQQDIETEGRRNRRSDRHINTQTDRQTHRHTDRASTKQQTTETKKKTFRETKREI